MKEKLSNKSITKLSNTSITKTYRDNKEIIINILSSSSLYDYYLNYSNSNSNSNKELSNISITQLTDAIKDFLGYLSNEKLVNLLYSFTKIQRPYFKELVKVSRMPSNQVLINYLERLADVIERVGKDDPLVIKRKDYFIQFSRYPPQSFYKFRDKAKKFFCSDLMNKFFEEAVDSQIKYRVENHMLEEAQYSHKILKEEVKELEKVSPRELEFMKTRKYRLNENPNFLKGITRLYNNEFNKKLTQKDFLKKMDYILKEKESSK